MIIEKEITQLYRHYDINNNLLYVGISDCSKRRFEEHLKNSSWSKLSAKMNVDYYPTRNHALDAERKAIKTEMPIWNKTHNNKNVLSSRYSNISNVGEKIAKGYEEQYFSEAYKDTYFILQVYLNGCKTLQDTLTICNKNTFLNGSNSYLKKLRTNKKIRNRTENMGGPMIWFTK